MQRVTLNLPDELADMLRSRAHHNLRSVSKEVRLLVETAIASELETNLAILRMVEHSGLSPAHTEHTGTALN